MDQDLFDWLLLLLRWLHIVVAVTWIGTSIFFMWLDRTLEPNPNSEREGHVGELWMVHGGGFYHVEKMLMGPTKVPEHLHWFKWESYWTWLSGFALICAIFYTGGGTFLLDDSVSNLNFHEAALLSLFSIFGSWFFYDFVWENSIAKDNPLVGHAATLLWLAGMSYLLCHTISGRAAYIHIGGMLGTWMTANVFMRIIPRQLEMVESSRQGKPINKEWGVNAKNRSTHNTYFTLPVIFIMLSNHFPATYGHEYNWIVLLLLVAAGAAIREYFVVRLSNPKRSKRALVAGLIVLAFTIQFTREGDGGEEFAEPVITETINVEEAKEPEQNNPAEVMREEELSVHTIRGIIGFSGKVPQGKKLRLPRACEKKHKGTVYSNEVLVNNGKLQNVFVHVIKGHQSERIKQYYSPIPSKPTVLDQNGCIYVPRVVIARVGQKVNILNSDPIFHNVKSVTKENKRFNMAMPKMNQVKTKVFTRPEIFLQTKCSVHPWMGAFIAVMDHPYGSVSDKSGKVEIKDLPTGKYTIEAWHEVYGKQTKEIEVFPGKIPNISFTFQAN